MNIAEILKNVPKGTKLYSTVIGYVELLCVTDDLYNAIKVKACNNDTIECFTKEGKYTVYSSDGECVLFPSKENRDWSTFKVKTSCNFKPFDKVLVRNEDNEPWVIQFFGYYDELAEDGAPYICLGNSMCIANVFKQCISFEGNEELLGHYDNV